MHAYGLAVDINPIENPWVRADKYAKANDLTLADTMWERYLTGPAEPDLSKHVTEVFWPLA